MILSGASVGCIDIYLQTKINGAEKMNMLAVITLVLSGVDFLSMDGGGPGDLALPAISFVAKAVTALFAC